MRWRALILIQASSAAQCSGKVGVLSNSPPKEETGMNFSTPQHNHSCGIDLPAKALSVCLRDQAGTLLVQKNLPTTPAAVLRLIAPSREGLVVGGEGRCTWSWRADLWSQEGSAFVRGPALSRKARQGGKATTDNSAAPKIAVW